MSRTRGLNELTGAGFLLIQQKLELLEVLTGFETKNMYEVKNAAGQTIYYAAEDTGCCNRMCCGSYRPFDMQIVDASRNEVIHLYRPLRCQGCCCPCCLQSMEVSVPPGVLIGTIKQEWTLCRPAYTIKNHYEEIALRIQGPFCTSACCKSVKFGVMDLYGNRIGEISKHWGGVVREYATDADNFGISFPVNLDVNLKALLLGATFLIDYNFFENNDNN